MIKTDMGKTYDFGLRVNKLEKLEEHINNMTGLGVEFCTIIDKSGHEPTLKVYVEL